MSITTVIQAGWLDGLAEVRGLGRVSHSLRSGTMSQTVSQPFQYRSKSYSGKYA